MVLDWLQSEWLPAKPDGVSEKKWLVAALLLFHEHSGATALTHRQIAACSGATEGSVRVWNVKAGGAQVFNWMLEACDSLRSRLLRWAQIDPRQQDAHQAEAVRVVSKLGRYPARLMYRDWTESRAVMVGRSVDPVFVHELALAALLRSEGLDAVGPLPKLIRDVFAPELRALRRGRRRK